MESWGYARVSSEEQQADKGALRKQVEKLRAAGCTKIYWDIQSRTTEVREGLEQMILDLGNLPRRAIAFVKFTRIDRVGSSPKLFYSLLEILREKNIKFQALEQAIDPDTLGGELTIDILLAAAKFEVKMTTERIRSDRAHRRAQGKSHRIPPIGYHVDGDRYTKNNDPCVCLIQGKREFTVAELVRHLFDTFFEVKSVTATCRHFHTEFGITAKARKPASQKIQKTHVINNDDDLLNTVFLPAKNGLAYRYPHIGLQFSVSGMKHLLTNPIYAGGTLYNSYHGSSNKNTTSRKRKHFDQWEVTWNTHSEEAIITYEEHERVKALIRGNVNNRWASQDINEINPFSRLLVCAYCNASVSKYAKRKNKDDVVFYYQCRQRRLGSCDSSTMINSRSLEQQVIEILTAKAEHLAANIELEEKVVQEPPEVTALKKSLSDLEKFPFNPAIENAKEDIRQQINLLAIKQVKPSPVSKDFIISTFSSADFWHQLKPIEKQRALSETVKRILIQGNTVARIEFL